MTESDQIAALTREVEWLRSHVDVLTQALAAAQGPRAMRIVNEPTEPRVPGPPLPSVLRSRSRLDRQDKPTEAELKDFVSEFNKAAGRTRDEVPAPFPKEPLA